MDIRIEDQLRAFLRDSDFMDQGSIITDLDGTVVHEDQGRVEIPVPVGASLKELYELGRPLILNTLRFPLSVIRVFGREWYEMSKGPIPLVTLNGSQIGMITLKERDLVFDEINAFPLKRPEIEEILERIHGLLTAGLTDVLVFYYPRDWRIGEVLWTPIPENVARLKQKYPSASSVTAIEFEKLQRQLLSEDICMFFILINIPEDKLMAYQHTQRSSFSTTAGVDKLHGARMIAEHLGVNLAHSVGAGDTEMDRFLNGVGLALTVGDQSLPFRGVLQTIKLKTVLELGTVLFRLTELQKEMHP
jgi:hydroxymethylpyrimidine pyrophosphatase-like HAD family hydrolase